MIIEAITLDSFLLESKMKDFDCLDNSINNFFYNESLEIDHEDIAKTTLFINDESNDIVGFYTVNTGQISLEATATFQGSTVRPDVDIYPTVNLSYFAVDKAYQCKGYGKLIMAELFASVLALQEHCGFSFIYVESLNQSVEFYESTGFNFLLHNYHEDRSNGFERPTYDMFISPRKLIDMGFYPHGGYKTRRLKYKPK